MPHERRGQSPGTGGHHGPRAPLQSSDLRPSFWWESLKWDDYPACILICGSAFAVACNRVDVVKPRCAQPSQHPLSLERT